MQKSEIIFKSAQYTACEMKDGSLIVTKNKTQEGRRMYGESAPYWIDCIKNAIDVKEAHVLCRALFRS